MAIKHKSRALAIHCIDFRFQTQIDKDLVNRGLKDRFDRISHPGASKDFGVVKRAAKISIVLHDPDEVLIYEHEDCGVYQENNSQEAHRKNAQKLAAFLRKTKPAIEVTTLIATVDGIKEL